MVGGNVLQEYLISLGFAVDNNQLRQFQNTLNGLSRQIERSYVSASTTVVAAIAGITGATAALLDKTAKADLEYQKFALRMFMGVDAAKRMKTALDAMGESIEDIAWFPELRERYQAFMQEQKALMPPGNFEDQMRRIRDIRNEFTRFSIIMTYGAQWVGHNLVKYLNVPIGEFQRWLIGVNDYLKENLPVWSDKIAYFLTKVIDLGEAGAKAVKKLIGALGEVWEALGPGRREIAVVGGLVWLFSKAGPIVKAVMVITGIMVALEDFWGYLDGKKSTPELAPIWHNLLEIGKQLKDTFKDLTDTVGDFFKALLPIEWPSIFNFLDDMTFKLAQAARIARIVMTGLKAEPYRWDNSPEGRAKWADAQERLRMLNEEYDKASERHEREMQMSPEERVRRWQRQDASSAASGTMTERERQGMAFFISKGWSPEQAAGIMGSGRYESGGEYNPNAKEAGGSGFGVFQWTSPERVAGLKAFAAARGKSVSDLMTQYEFAQYELEQHPEWMDDLRKATTARAAARSFSERFENPDRRVWNIGQRQSFADEALQRWHNENPAGGIGPTSFNTNVGSLNVYVANTNATPEEIARAVKEELYQEQAISNARMMRETAGAFG